MMMHEMWYGKYGDLLKPSYKKRFAKYENNLELQIQIERGINIWLDEFEWKGLPATCDATMIEKQLLFRGAAGFYKDKSDNILSLGAGLGGRFNMNGKPTTAYLYGFDGTNFESEIYWPASENEDTARCVIIQDNYTYSAPIMAVESGAKRIAKAKRNLDTAAANAKFPFILQCTEEQKRAILDIYNEVQENQPLILINKGSDFTEENTMTFNTNIKEGILKELWDYYQNTKSDVFNDWGIQMNQNNDKKERMTITEVEGNTDFIKIVNGYRLRLRQEAAENANKLFGTNISVSFRYEDEEHDSEILDKMKGESKDNEGESNKETV